MVTENYTKSEEVTGERYSNHNVKILSGETGSYSDKC
jgi:hypothetical protein